MLGLPRWLYPITPATIAIIALPIVLILCFIDAMVSNWREDRHDDDKGQQ